MREVNASLYSTLTGGTALTALLAGTTSVYHMIAPDGASLPYIVFGVSGGGPENVTPSDMRSLVYLVRCYGRTGSESEAIHAAASALLHRKTLTVSGYTNIATLRETDVETVEAGQDGSKIYMSGAYYRIKLDS